MILVIKCTRLLMALGLVLVTNLARGQTITPNVVDATGGSYSGGNVSLSWSLGEVSIQTYTSGSDILTEGLLQPEPIITSGIREFVNQGDLMVFPNPFSDRIWIKWNNSTPVVHVSIFSMTGQKVFDDAYGGDGIDAGNLVPGMYILFAYRQGDNDYSSFKILKN
jgi:hypothetical protein